MAKSLVLYVKEGCPYCQKVRDYMEEKGIEISMKFINQSEENRRELAEKGGKEQVPCLLVDGEPLYESDDIIEWMKSNL